VAPEFEGVEDFDPREVRLPSLAVCEAGPFVFVGLENDIPPLDERLLADFQQMGDGLRYWERRTYEVDCNWKVYVDNYLDGGYHIAHLHPSLHGVLDYARYRTELFDGWNVQHSPMRKGEVDDVRSGRDAQYYWIFPNLMVNSYEGILDVNRVIPLAPDKCAVQFDYWFSAQHDAAFMERSIEVSERIQDEDRDICAAVQRGLGSRWYDRGRYSVRRENGQHQFHRLLSRALR